MPFVRRKGSSVNGANCQIINNENISCTSAVIDESLMGMFFKFYPFKRLKMSEYTNNNVKLSSEFPVAHKKYGTKAQNMADRL